MGPAPPLSASSLASRDEALALFLFDAHAPAGEARGDACEAFFAGMSIPRSLRFKRSGGHPDASMVPSGPRCTPQAVERAGCQEKCHLTDGFVGW